MKDIAKLGLALLFGVSTSLVQPDYLQAEEPKSQAVGNYEDEIYDPFEGLNRGIFWFNDQFDIYLLEPVAQGYDWIMPNRVQTSIGNFFNNLRYPAYLLSDVVQLKFSQVAHHTGRFVLNSVLGIGGLFDVATDMGLEEHEEDFGIALAYHDIPPGPYIVLPLIGPSNVRDALGRAVDTVVSPFFHLGTMFNMDSGDAFAVGLGAKSLDVVDQRANLFDAVEAAKESSLDYYLFMQSAFYQYRRGLLYDGAPPGEEEEPFE